LLALGNAWVGATGGEWQGHKDCGCGPTHYALRFTAVTDIKVDNDVAFRSAMMPVDIPITFRDDGTFAGEAATTSQGAGAGDGCTLQSAASLKLSVSGKAVQTYKEHYLEVTLKTAAPTVSEGTARCPNGTFARRASGASDESYTVRLEGNVGEAASVPLRSPAPEVTSVGEVRIVKLPQ
jgi:hypothetical protein